MGYSHIPACILVLHHFIAIDPDRISKQPWQDGNVSGQQAGCDDGLRTVTLTYPAPSGNQQGHVQIRVVHHLGTSSITGRPKLYTIWEPAVSRTDTCCAIWEPAGSHADLRRIPSGNHPETSRVMCRPAPCPILEQTESCTDPHQVPSWNQPDHMEIYSMTHPGTSRVTWTPTPCTSRVRRRPRPCAGNGICACTQPHSEVTAMTTWRGAPVQHASSRPSQLSSVWYVHILSCLCAISALRPEGFWTNAIRPIHITRDSMDSNSK